ncbi:MAG: hypothetical protein M3132_13130 [Actinomycetia bacterium]|nr:hypothetical protein [Actinomycetes bacterium]
MTNTTHTPVRPGIDGPVAVTWLLLFVQGAIAVALSAEALGATIIFGGLPLLGALLSVAATTFTLVLVARIPKRRPSTRKWIMRLQVGWITMGLLDLALALGLAGRGLTPVGFLVRIVLPVSIFWLLRRPAARSEFGVTKKTRKKNGTKDEVVGINDGQHDWELEEMWA